MAPSSRVPISRSKKNFISEDFVGKNKNEMQICLQDSCKHLDQPAMAELMFLYLCL